ncbi:MAG: HNH endonuclease, partial [bacterium]
MSITLATSKVLWARARDQCAFPGCQQALTQESTDAATGEVRTTPVGEQAHIRSSKPDGPRHDHNYPASRVHTHENLILLCPTHHARVDANKGAEFTVEALIDMRKMHETQAKRRGEIEKTVQKYVAQQYGADDRVLFEQVDLNGPTVDSMFVDVP